MPEEQTAEQSDQIEPAEFRFACPHCGQPVSIAFGPTGEVDAEKAE
jgi:hypothetical protein